jgi:diguanylate cyclase (GGDEF)-like protein
MNATSVGTISLFALAAPVATFIGIRRNRPNPSWPWWALFAALVLWLASGIARAATHQLSNLTASRSFVPDALSLPAYVCLASAFFGFARARIRALRDRLHVLYDSIIAGLALLACSWVYIIDPVLSAQHAPLWVRASLVSYPACSLVLIVITFQIAYGTPHVRTASEGFLLLAMCAMFVGDTVYMLAEIRVINNNDAALNLPYIITYIAAIYGVLHPSMRGITEASVRRPTAWSPIRIALVSVALIVPMLLVFQTSHKALNERLGVIVAGALLTATAILQIVQAMRSVDRSESRLMHNPLHDTLTGLPNRTLLEGHLSDNLTKAAGTAARVGLVYVDIDKLRWINDTLGQSLGDAVLCEVARRLSTLSKTNEVAGRITADEFALILTDLPSEESATDRAHGIRDALQRPFEIDGQEIAVTVSIGLAVANINEIVDPELLIRDGAAAMYRAKEAGRAAVAIFDDKMRTHVAEQVEIARDLRLAVRQGQLKLAYQPVVDMHRGVATGVEALVRWEHPKLGLLMPNSFIKLAEESDDILEIGTWVLEEALRQVAIFRTIPGMESFSVAVNLSALQLRDQLLVQRVSRIITASGLPGSAVTLELTESEILRDFEAASSAFDVLRRRGVKLAVDDFGTEYSSLSNLKKLPVDILKIDKSFVDGVCRPDSSDSSLIAAMLALSNALGIETIAEGIETEDQAQALRNLGCVAAQGYLYSRPLPAPELVNKVKELADASRELVTAHGGSQRTGRRGQ